MWKIWERKNHGPFTIFVIAEPMDEGVMKKSLGMILIIVLPIGSVPAQLIGQKPTSRIVGTVLDVQCTPLRNARIIATTLEETILAETVTNENGRYSLGNVVQGQLRLALVPHGSEFQRGTIVANLGSETLDVNWVASSSFNAIRLMGSLIHAPGQISQGAATVTGNAFTDDGKPIPNIYVLLKSLEGKVLSQTETNAEGRYQLVSQVPGAYQLTLDPLKSRFLGNTVPVCLCSGTLAINWIVSTTAHAVPTQHGSGFFRCGGLLGLGVFSAGVTAMGIGAGANQPGSPRRRVASPSM